MEHTKEKKEIEGKDLVCFMGERGEGAIHSSTFIPPRKHTN